MICDICLEDNVLVINIFNEEGLRCKIPSIIRKHFWFEPKEDDPTLSHICQLCWEQIDNFHVFYTSVKEAHEKIKSDCYKRYWQDDNGVAYTIDDSEDEHSRRSPPEKTEALPTVNKENNEENISPENIKCEPNFNLAEDARLFLMREHEALLNEYTYVEPTVNELLLQYDDNNEYSFNSSSIGFLTQFSKKTSTIEKKLSFENIQPTSYNFVTALKRKEPKSKFDSYDLERTLSNEDTLIRKYIILECELCFVKLETFNELNVHYQITHQISGYARCCGKKLPTRSYILDHINQHVNPENYTCKECSKTVSTQYAIKNHLAIKHAPESSKVYKCEECPERFTNDYSLNKHLLQHKNELEKQLFCTDCGKMFSSSQSLEKHRSAQHKRMSGHICHVCGTILKGKKAFGKHIREHAAILGFDAINDPVCPICGKLSASIKTLRHHIRYVHSAMRPHECPVCGKGFKIRQKLKEHLGTHAVGVSLPCPYCPKRFRSKIHVYSHKYRMHKREYDMERNARLEDTSNTVGIKD